MRATNGCNHVTPPSVLWMYEEVVIVLYMYAAALDLMEKHQVQT